MVKGLLFLPLAAVLLLPGVLPAQEVVIDHSAPACALSGRPSRLLARVSPARSAASVKVYFHAKGGPRWCAVPMKLDMPSFAAVLPRPESGAAELEYFIEATSASAQVTRTPTYTLQIVTGPERCAPGQPMALVGDRVSSAMQCNLDVGNKAGPAEARAPTVVPPAAAPARDPSAETRAARAKADAERARAEKEAEAPKQAQQKQDPQRPAQAPKEKSRPTPEKPKPAARPAPAKSAKVTPTGLVAIAHAPIRCISDTGFTTVAADLKPHDLLSEARAYFRRDLAGPWCYVTLKGPSPHQALFPPPGAATADFYYYLEAVDVERGKARSDLYLARVFHSGGPEVCAQSPAPFVQNTTSPPIETCLEEALVQVPERLNVAPLVAVGGGRGALALLGLLGAAGGAAGVAVAVGGGASPTPTLTPTPTTPPSSGTATATPIGSTATPTPTSSGGATATPTPTCETVAPTVDMTGPNDGDTITAVPVTLSATASDNLGVAEVEFFVRPLTVLGGIPIGPAQSVGVDPDSPYSVQWTPTCNAGYRLWAVARDACGNQTQSATIEIQLTVGILLPCAGALSRDGGPPSAATVEQSSADNPVVWTSNLTLPGGSGQIVINDGQAAQVSGGPQQGALALRLTNHRLWARVTAGEGKRGTWRFDLRGAGIQAILSGRASRVTPDSVVFELSGEPGETVAFTLRRPQAGAD